MQVKEKMQQALLVSKRQTFCFCTEATVNLLTTFNAMSHFNKRKPFRLINSKHNKAQVTNLTHLFLLKSHIL